MTPWGPALALKEAQEAIVNIHPYPREVTLDSIEGPVPTVLQDASGWCYYVLLTKRH